MSGYFGQLFIAIKNLFFAAVLTFSLQCTIHVSKCRIVFREIHFFNPYVYVKRERERECSQLIAR